jgi:hypothetical protein
VDAIYSADMTLYLKFLFLNGRSATFPYSDVIHLRQDFNDNDVFGESPALALEPLMNIVSTTDQGIIKAIKNSSVVQWLLKFMTSMRPEDLKKQATDFVANYLSIDSTSIGVAAVDSKAEAVRVEPKEYVPNASQMDRTTDRIYSFYNTNKKIVQSSYGEDDWTAYFEAEVEPVEQQLRLHLPNLPTNVRVIGADDPQSSYPLIAASDAVLTFTSTTGLEAALLGKPVIVSGTTHYRDKGFTLDVSSAAEFEQARERLS